MLYRIDILGWRQPGPIKSMLLVIIGRLGG